MKRCRYCRRLFKPNPRTAYEQRTCSAAECQKKRKKDGQIKWLKKNPKYFQGRYPQVKEWLDEHPGYLKEYRRNNRNHAGTGRRTAMRRGVVSLPEVRAGLEARVIAIEQLFSKLPWSDIQVALEARNPDMKPVYTQFTHG